MDNLKSRLHSQLVEPEGCVLEMPQGRYGIRSHLPLTISTDGQFTEVEPNVDSFFSTLGTVQILVRHPVVPVEIWPVTPAEELAPAVDPVAPPEASPTE